MKIRLYNARILTMENDGADQGDIFKGEIWINGDRIEAVKRYPSESLSIDVATAQFDREVDCGENLLLPGFKNCHTHSAMTFLRSYADDSPLKEWLETKVFPMEAKLTSEDIYWFTKLAILEYFSGGITAIGDMYLQPEITARACNDMGMRCTLISGLNNFTSSLEQTEREYLTWNSKEQPLVKYCFGFHAQYTCSDELLRGLSHLIHKYKAPVFMHLQETASEVESCKAEYGLTPVAYLESLGLLDYGGGGYHCVHMNEEDRRIMQRHGMYVITNPASNAKLASGMAPIEEYIQEDFVIGIGTDGAASNNCLDMFREMFLVSGLSKLREQNAAVTDANRVLKMAVSDGARVLQVPDADCIGVGKLADLVLIDLNKPNMHPMNNISKNLVYSGNQSNVMMTMVGGKIVYQNGSFFLGETAQSIYEECEKRSKVLQNRA